MCNYLKIILNKSSFKKDLFKALAFSLAFTIFLSLSGFDAKCQTLRDNIFRLHIIANSDSKEDQAVKLKVRDEILKQTGNIFENAATKTDAIKLSNENIEKIRHIAEKTLQENGFEYGVTVSVGKAWFGTREYENFTLPAGYYDALKVKIGKAKGKNWWCVMFPAMCLPAATDYHKLSEAVDEKSADIAENSGKYEIRFKTVEIFESIRSKLIKQ